MPTDTFRYLGLNTLVQVTQTGGGINMDAYLVC
jgi:hypothetical protein